VPTTKALRFHQRALDILRQREAARAEFAAEKDKTPRPRIGALATIASGDIEAASADLRRHETQ